LSVTGVALTITAAQTVTRKVPIHGNDVFLPIAAYRQNKVTILQPSKQRTYFYRHQSIVTRSFGSPQFW
jgi:hypothetical protein